MHIRIEFDDPRLKKVRDLFLFSLFLVCVHRRTNFKEIVKFSRLLMEHGGLRLYIKKNQNTFYYTFETDDMSAESMPNLEEMLRRKNIQW